MLGVVAVLVVDFPSFIVNWLDGTFVLCLQRLFHAMDCGLSRGIDLDFYHGMDERLQFIEQPVVALSQERCRCCCKICSIFSQYISLSPKSSSNHWYHQQTRDCCSRQVTHTTVEAQDPSSSIYIIYLKWSGGNVRIWLCRICQG